MIIGSKQGRGCPLRHIPRRYHAHENELTGILGAKDAKEPSVLAWLTQLLDRLVTIHTTLRSVDNHRSEG